MNRSSAENRDIAIVGMACVFPGARDLNTYWANNVNQVDAITDVPGDRWDSELFRCLPEGHEVRITCTRGGFIPRDIGFNPRRYGIMPNVLQHADPDQFVLLHIADAALKDAGIADGDPIRQRTDAIVGRGGYLSAKMAEVFLRVDSLFRVKPFLKQRFPELSSAELDELEVQLRSGLPSNSPDSLSTCIPNLVASRMSNRMNLGGVAYVVDAACASSLIALEQGIARLRNRQCDLSVISGVHLCQIPPFWFVFTHLRALSKSGVVRPFDRRADGLLLGEGVGTVVLKRLDDARANGDKIYAVIKGVGSASDAGETSVLMPSSSGQVRALQAAYQDARVDPDTISYLETHGTGTVAGDPVELETIRSFFGSSDSATRALGSVKSMIGHTMPAAGIASLIRTVMALSNKVIPPTINSDEPRPALAETPFYLPLEARPWIHPKPGLPRRAGVSAFGFGGINSHVVLEEFVESVGVGVPIRLARPVQSVRTQPTEIALFSADSSESLRDKLSVVHEFLKRDQSGATLADVCFTLQGQVDFAHPVKLGLICHDIKEMQRQLAERVAKDDSNHQADRGESEVFFSDKASTRKGKLAVLFPGLAIPGLVGNYPKHLLQMAIHFPELREELDKFEAKDKHAEDRVPLSCILDPPTTIPESLQESRKLRLAPPPAFDDLQASSTVSAAERNLSGVGVVLSNWLGWTLLKHLGVIPDMVAGQSFGDLVALAVADTVDFESVVRPSVWQTLLDPATLQIPGRMAFATVDEGQLEKILAEHKNVSVAAYMSPRQVLLGGSTESVEAIVNQLRLQGIMAVTLPYVPGHTSHMSHLRDQYVGQQLTALASPKLPVYSSISADVFPADDCGIRELVTANLDHPIRFWQTNRKMYDDGARVFIQAGCSGIAGNVRAGLPDDNVVSVDIDAESQDPITQLNLLVGTLFAAGMRFDPALLFRCRGVRRLSWREPQVHRPAPQEEIRLSLEWLMAPELACDVALPSSPDVPVADPSGDAPPRIPFTGHVNRYIPGQDISVTRRFELHEDLYLQDHYFVNAIGYKPLEQCLPVLPMVMTMEFVAETGAYLAPGLGLVGIEDVKALHWIWLEDVSSVDVRVEARVAEGESEEGVRRIHARVFCADRVCASATVFFSAQYRQNINLSFASGTRTRPWPCSWGQLYGERFTFHGPRFQSVASFGRLSEDGLEGTLLTLPRHDLFASVRNPELLTDPAVIDGIGQLVGCWAQAHDCHVLPIGIEKLELYRPSPAPGVEVPVRIQITRHDRKAHIITANIEVQDGDGYVWMRLRGWSDVILPHSQRMMDVQRLPTEKVVAQLCTMPGLPANSVLTRVNCGELNRGNTQWVARLYLTACELESFVRMTTKRQREYLAGRIAAKDAVRTWLCDRANGRSFHPVEIALSVDDFGCPHVDTIQGITELPWISIAHSGGTATAVASFQPCGIDLEDLSDSTTKRMLGEFASASELRILAPLMESDPAGAWPTRLWCAKEAAAKALGTGLQGRPHQFELLEVQPGGIMHMRYQPDCRDIVVHTSSDGSTISALALPTET